MTQVPSTIDLDSTTEFRKASLKRFASTTLPLSATPVTHRRDWACRSASHIFKSGSALTPQASFGHWNVLPVFSGFFYVPIGKSSTQVERCCVACMLDCDQDIAPYDFDWVETTMSCESPKINNLPRPFSLQQQTSCRVRASGDTWHADAIAFISSVLRQPCSCREALGAGVGSRFFLRVDAGAEGPTSHSVLTQRTFSE